MIGRGERRLLAESKRSSKVWIKERAKNFWIAGGKMPFGIKRRKVYIALLMMLEGCMMGLRSLTNGMQNAQLARLHDVVNLQLIMLIFSTVIVKRATRLFDGSATPIRDAARALLILFVTLSHASWAFFYVYLPDDSVISIICFVCLAGYLHAACFLSISIVIETLCAQFSFCWTPPKCLISKNLHTILSFALAFLFTAAGYSATHFSPVVRRVDVDINDLPTSLNGFSTALLTDLHIGPTVRKQRISEIVSVVNSLEADVVAVAGDLVDGFIPNIGAHALPLAELKSKYGTFFATGNHEYYHGDVDEWLNFFSSRLNMTLLRNSHKRLYTSHGDYVCLAGVDDLFTEKLHLSHHRMDADKALRGCGPKAPAILLVHQPNGAKKIIQSVPNRRIDLILSGHTHGGQFYIFWLFAYFKNAYLHGLYHMKNSSTQIYVSPGVNYWGPPVKMNNLCEITLIRLRASY